MGFCVICKREHDERCDLCIYKDDPKSNVPGSPCKNCTLECDTLCKIYDDWLMCKESEEDDEN